MGNHFWLFCHRRDRVKEIRIKRNNIESKSVDKSTIDSESCPNKVNTPTPEPNLPETFYELTNYIENTIATPQQGLETPVASVDLINAQEKLITNLEFELSSVQKQVVVVKNTYEQKFNKYRANNAHLKAENALIVFELEDKINCLEEENNSLMNKLNTIEDSNGENLTDGKMHNPHSELILTLSEQLVATNDKLRDANSQIESLKQTQIQTNSL